MSSEVILRMGGVNLLHEAIWMSFLIIALWWLGETMLVVLTNDNMPDVVVLWRSD